MVQLVDVPEVSQVSFLLSVDLVVTVSLFSLPVVNQEDVFWAAWVLRAI